MSRQRETELFAVTRFLDDLVLSDRRLADRSDIKLIATWEGHFDELPYRMSEGNHGGGSYGIRLEQDGSGFVEIRADRELDRHESERVELLAAVIVYCLSKDRLLIAGRIGSILKGTRQSLKVSQQDVADQAERTRFTVWKWEVGAQAPSVAAIYRWCQALGVVCPPKTALVRVVDISPELMRFLQENPERLRALTPDQFEQFVAERLDRMGYQVTLTGSTNRKDGGIDLIAVPRAANLGSVVIAGQVKHHRLDQKTVHIQRQA